MALQSVNTGSGLNPIAAATPANYYARELLDSLKHYLVTLGYASRRPIPRNAGHTATWTGLAATSTGSGLTTGMSALAAKTTPLTYAGASTEGAPPTPSNLTMRTVSAAIFQFGDYVELTDFLDITSFFPLLMEAGREQGYQIALTLDAVHQTVVVGGSQVQYPTGAAARNQITSSMPITTTMLDSAIVTLKQRGVPMVTGWINGSTNVGTLPGLPAYIAFCTPLSTKAIRGLSGFVSVEQYASQAGGGSQALPFEIGRYRDIRFVETSTGLVFAGAGSGSVDVQALPIFGMDAFIRSTITGHELRLYERMPDVNPTASDPLAQKGHVGWKSLFTSAINQQQRIVRCEFYTAP